MTSFSSIVKVVILGTMSYVAKSIKLYGINYILVARIKWSLSKLVMFGKGFYCKKSNKLLIHYLK